jgi:hypothetical protein
MFETVNYILQLTWRKYDNILWGIANIENKSSSVIVVNGVLIAVSLSLLSQISSIYYLFSIIPFFISIILASGAIFSITSGVVYQKDPYELINPIFGIADKSELHTKLLTIVGDINRFADDAKKVGDTKLRWYNYSILFFIIGIGVMIGTYVGIVTKTFL